MTRRLSLPLVMLVAATALLAAAALGSPNAETPKGGTLRISLHADVDSVDPALAYAAWSMPIGYATCAKLFNYPDARGAAGTRVAPEVVDRFKVSQDRRTYTFTLKQSFRFHTGDRVVAQSFADAFNRVAQPKLESPATAYMREIEGAAAVIDGKARSISGIRVLGPYRLQIRLTRPTRDLTARLTLPFFCPILPSTPVDAALALPPGSGPYYVAERIVNQRIVLRRNPYYRGNRHANVDGVVWTVDDPEACRLAVEQNRIDYCGEFGQPDGAYRALAKRYGINRPGGRFFVNQRLATSFIAFNHDRRAFRGRGQIPLKKAINFAIDRLELAHAFGYLKGKPTDQILPPPFARPATIYPLGGAAPGAARSWLARARYRPKELVLYAFNLPRTVAMAQILASNLKQIGIDVRVKYFDPYALFEKVKAPGEPYDLVQGGFFADYADPAGFLVPLLGADSGANANFDDPHLTRQIEAADRLTDDGARRKAWAELEVDLMRDNPPWAPILHDRSRVVVSRSIGCFLEHPVYHFDIAAACKR
jgi:ABC-type oligopeptide transport system substrate-binding subunit